MAEQRDVQALVETVLVGIDSTDFGSGEKERRSAARAALDSLAAELVTLKDALEAFDEKWYPMLASKVIAEQHEFGHEAAVTAWNQLCRDLRALVDSPAAAREALGGPDDA